MKAPSGHQRRRTSRLRENIIGVLQAAFAVGLLLVFVVAWCITSDAIVMPRWTETWQNTTVGERNGYAVALFVPILSIMAVMIFAGIMVMRSGGGMDYSSA
ncbi:hypothetical protein F5Y15DRAFT_415501 [Xylariaceae sp. FL0016]|nr:hypothetical protein F5Y15DRAFT_415501 [Xylariaceae sp. FL0016]